MAISPPWGPYSEVASFLRPAGRKLASASLAPSTKDRTLTFKPASMPVTMPNRMSNRMSERLQDGMLERLPEIMPLRNAG